MILKNLNLFGDKPPIFNPYINTGTPFDCTMGSFIPGVDNKWVLNGGFHCSTVFGGMTGTFKSGEAGSVLGRMLNIHPLSEGCVYETENNVASVHRYDDFIPKWDPKVSDRITFIGSSDMRLDQWFDNVVLPACEEREKHQKDYIIEGPMIDPRTGKLARIWIPMFFLTDSYSAAQVSTVMNKMRDKKIKTDSKETNTIFLNEGLVKTRINRTLPTLASQYGLYIIVTAHIDEKGGMSDMMSHPTKAMQYLPLNQVFKHVGGSFEFLASTLLHTAKATAMTHPKEKTEAWYHHPDGDTVPNEVNEVRTVLVKGKNNAGGVSIPFMVSQFTGILNETTEYHLLKEYDSFGFSEPNARVLKLMLYPDKGLTRQNIRKLIEDDYMLRRALEITFQIGHIKKYWLTGDMGPSMNMPMDEIVKRFTSSKVLSEEILNSTGVWSTSKQEREYMSIPDILNKLYELK